MTDTLKFGMGNAKLSANIAIFDLPAGHSCPFAKDCLSKSDRITGKIIDGHHCQFRCYAASGEARATNVRKKRWGNFEILKGAKTEQKIGDVIQRSLPVGIDKVRIHSSGDFFNEHYFVAWVNVALNNPLITFYGYSKAMPWFVKYKQYIPTNFRFTASKGGTHDHLIERSGLRSVEVVFSVEEAANKGLEIDHDDSHTISPINKDYAVLLHGFQPRNSAAAAAWSKLLKKGIGGYGKLDKNHFRSVETPPHVVYVHVNMGKKIKLAHV